MKTTNAPTTWTHGGYIYHRTHWRIAPGYGAVATCLECDWAKSWGDYRGDFSGWVGGASVERACLEHEDTTRVRPNG